MKIILEGADGTGKTTLAKMLVEKYDISYMNINREDPNDYPFYFQTLRKNKIVYDRHFIGEMIYPNIFNRKQNLLLMQFKHLLEFSKENNFKILVLFSENETILNRQKNDEYEEVTQNILKINDSFIDIANKFGIQLVDVTKTNFEEICELIENG